MPALTTRALDEALPEPQRKLAIDTLAFIPERPAAMAMREIAAQTTGPLAEMAHWWIRNRATSIWRDHQIDPGPADPAAPTKEAVALPVLDPARATKLPPAEEIAALPGDAARGRALFFGKAACHACHLVRQEGRDVGPDLTGVATLFDRKVLIDSLLDPSAAIATGYDTTVITTKDHRTLTGFLLSTGDPVLLKDLAGNRISLASKEIARTKRLESSPMPAASALGLTAREVADLAAFLVSVRPAD